MKVQFVTNVLECDLRHQVFTIYSIFLCTTTEVTPFHRLTNILPSLNTRY